jgi:hypothetical protein
MFIQAVVPPEARPVIVIAEEPEIPNEAEVVPEGRTTSKVGQVGKLPALA